MCLYVVLVFLLKAMMIVVDGLRMDRGDILIVTYDKGCYIRMQKWMNPTKGFVIW